MKRPIEKPLRPILSRSNSLAQFAMAPPSTVIGSELSAIPGQEGPEGRERDPAEMEICFSEEDELAQSVAAMEAPRTSVLCDVFLAIFFRGKWYGNGKWKNLAKPMP